MCPKVGEGRSEFCAGLFFCSKHYQHNKTHVKFNLISFTHLSFSLYLSIYLFFFFFFFSGKLVFFDLQKQFIFFLQIYNKMSVCMCSVVFFSEKV